jgi:hypothetical protein
LDREVYLNTEHQYMEEEGIGEHGVIIAIVEMVADGPQ